MLHGDESLEFDPTKLPHCHHQQGWLNGCRTQLHLVLLVCQWDTLQGQGTHVRYNPGNLLPAEFRKWMAEAPWDKSVRARTFGDVCNHFTPVFHHLFLENFHTPADWFMQRLTFTQSSAASSIVWFILGLGNCHSQNILIDKATADEIHIDLGVVFGQGKALKTPEVVPFRLTWVWMVCDGDFRRCCENAPCKAPGTWDNAGSVCAWSTLQLGTLSNCCASSAEAWWCWGISCRGNICCCCCCWSSHKSTRINTWSKSRKQGSRTSIAKTQSKNIKDLNMVTHWVWKVKSVNWLLKQKIQADSVKCFLVGHHDFKKIIIKNQKNKRRSNNEWNVCKHNRNTNHFTSRTSWKNNRKSKCLCSFRNGKAFRITCNGNSSTSLIFLFLFLFWNFKNTHKHNKQTNKNQSENENQKQQHSMSSFHFFSLELTQKTKKQSREWSGHGNKILSFDDESDALFFLCVFVCVFFTPLNCVVCDHWKKIVINQKKNSLESSHEMIQQVHMFVVLSFSSLFVLSLLQSFLLVSGGCWFVQEFSYYVVVCCFWFNLNFQKRRRRVAFIPLFKKKQQEKKWFVIVSR